MGKIYLTVVVLATVVLAQTKVSGDSLSSTTEAPSESSSSSLTTATISDCEDLKDPVHGSVTTDTNITKYNSTATYTCQEGYDLSGNNTRLCEDDGSWSGTNSSCELKDCGDLTDPVHGSVTTDTNTTKYNSTATYTCQEGYDLSGNNTRLCEDDGSWSGTNSSCELKDCGNLTNLGHGSVTTYTNTNKYNSTATYTCQEGYGLSGNNTRLCQADGSWSGTKPSCELKDCGNLTNPVHGSVTTDTNTNKYNSTATYACQKGYDLCGNNTRRCQANGTWSGTDPSCELIYIDYNDTCTQNGSLGECKTHNSHCLEYNNAGFNTCQCDKWNYKDKNSCLLQTNWYGTWNGSETGNMTD